MPTLIISLIVAAVLVLAIIQIRKDKKKGNPFCAGQCSGCPNGEFCNASKGIDKNDI